MRVLDPLSRAASWLSADRPASVLVWSVAVTVLLYAVGVEAMKVQWLSYGYYWLFPISFAVVYAAAIYNAKSAGPFKLYLVSMAMAYVVLAAISALPGAYLAASSPAGVQSFAQGLESFKETYTTIPSMAIAIFEHNLQVDLLSYIPVGGAALFGLSLMNSFSYVWAMSFSLMPSPAWFAGVAAVLIAPDTFTEISSYALAVAGGYELYRAIAGAGADRWRSIYLSAALLASSVALLMASAFIEAYLILALGL